MSVEDLAERLAVPGVGGADDLQLVDVREEWEHDTAALPHFKLLPLSKWVVVGASACLRVLWCVSEACRAIAIVSLPPGV
jgi:hypothetical protein